MTIEVPSSFAKLGWADQHLNHLKESVRTFEKPEAVELVPKFKPKRPGHDVVFVAKKAIPPDISPRAGDVVGNLRDALDHLIYELSLAYTGAEVDNCAWPVYTSRSRWPLKSKSGKDDGSGEFKIRGIDPKWQIHVKRRQPFYGKRKDPIRVSDMGKRIHWIWFLDRLRNIDRHRRLSLVVATVYETNVGIEWLNPDIHLISRRPRRKPGKDGSVIERFWYTPGAVESDVRVKGEATPKVVIYEPSLRQRYTPLVETLDSLWHSTCDLLLFFYKLQGYSEEALLEGVAAL